MTRRWFQRAVAAYMNLRHGDEFRTARANCITHRIPKELTGLRGNLFVHVDRDDDGRFIQLRVSHKGKDDSTLDRILHAIGDVATDIIRGLGK